MVLYEVYHICCCWIYTVASAYSTVIESILSSFAVSLFQIISMICTNHFYDFSAAILKVTDRRVKIMSEIIKSMRIIKMYSWESAFEKEVRQIRKSVARSISSLTKFFFIFPEMK